MMFKYLIGNKMEVYVDNMLVKSKIVGDHMEHLGENVCHFKEVPNETQSLEVHIWSGIREVAFIVN